MLVDDAKATRSMSADPAYDKYWQRKKLLMAGAPDFPVRSWWQDEATLCDSDNIAIIARKPPALT